MKQSLRKAIRKTLAGMDPAVAHAKSMAVCHKMMGTDEFQRARVMMIYLPLPEEVDVSPVALRGWQDQKTVTAPKLSWDQRHMLPIEIRSMEFGLVAQASGLREPADGEPVPIDSLDLVVVPALIFDRRGHRLGRGAGFYDRFLASPEFGGITIGVAFREQLTDRLPAHDHDMPVDMLVTDEEILRFAREDQTT